MVDITSWATTVGDDTRLNRCTNIANTGTYLSSIDKTKHGIVICTATGGGLTVNHVYLCSADGLSFIDISSIASHTHTSSTDGGVFDGIVFANPKFMDLALTQVDDLTRVSATVPWIETVTGTGTTESNTDGTTGERALRLRPNATSGSGATISYPHLKLDFSKNAMLQSKLRIETFSSIAIHSGVGADDVTAADSNTRKFQAELCTVTNNNWWLRTASGSANSASDTGIAATANRVALRIKHFPALPETQLQVDTGTLLQKTTNIPIDNATADNNLIKHSVKNSTGADRPLLVYGSRLQYYISDNWV